MNLDPAYNGTGNGFKSAMISHHLNEDRSNM